MSYHISENGCLVKDLLQLHIIFIFINGILSSHSYFRVEKRLDSFYSLLIKESLDREDVEAMEKENLKDCHEILQMFRNSKGVSKYMVTRALIQLMVGSLLCVLLLWIFTYSLVGPEINCEVLNLHYVCIVPLASFYYGVLATALFSSHGFVACCIYKLIWFSIPNIMSPFAKLMRNKRDHIEEGIQNEKTNRQVLPVFTKCLPCADTAEPFFDVYQNPKSPDFGLLITMLATKNGVAEGLRILALFDNEYQKLWKPLTLTIYHGTSENSKDNCFPQEMNAVTVKWTDAPIAPFIDSYDHKCKLKVTYYIAP